MAANANRGFRRTTWQEKPTNWSKTNSMDIRLWSCVRVVPDSSSCDDQHWALTVDADKRASLALTSRSFWGEVLLLLVQRQAVTTDTNYCFISSGLRRDQMTPNPGFINQVCAWKSLGIFYIHTLMYVKCNQGLSAAGQMMIKANDCWKWGSIIRQLDYGEKIF